MRKDKIILGLGSNIGDSVAIISEAVQQLEQFFGETAVKSSYYETEPWGFNTESNFINQCVYFSVNNLTTTPEQLLVKIGEIEKKLGRKRSITKKYSSRKIDIDILYFKDKIIKSDQLTIPHPRISERNFVLFPLAEILPDHFDSKSKKTVLALKNLSKDEDIPRKLLDISMK